jgi:muramoyltetrapeptide carboxypeptidase
MLDDESIQAVLCGRGGYGTSRIIDDLNFRKFRKHPKWIIGYSDITVLLAHVYRNFKIATMHAPMAGAFNDEGYTTEFVQSLRKVLAGDRSAYN